VKILTPAKHVLNSEP